MTNFKKAVLFLGVLSLAVFVRVRQTEEKNSYFPTELVYKTVNNTQLKLDVYYPKDTLTKHKTLLYFHGGSWISGGKIKVLERYRNFAVKTLLDNHIEIISADYRLIRKDNSLEDCLEDCISATDFCLKNADYLRIDTSDFGLWGSSAGAHLALMSYIFSDKKNIKVIVDDFAPTDIYKMWSVVPEVFRKEFSTIFYRLKDKNIEKFDSLSKVFSPVNYTDNLKNIPILISHGTNDKIVDFSQSVSLKDSLTSNCKFYSYENLGHGFKNADSLEIKNYAKRLINFLKK